MSIRIPYPIPEPERTRLIRAGIDACATPLNSPHRAAEQANVRRAIADIGLRYGYDDGEVAA